MSKQPIDAGGQREAPVPKRDPNAIVRALERARLQQRGRLKEAPAAGIRPVPLNRPRVLIARQHVGRRPEPSAEEVMVRYGLMRRSWLDWGFRRGAEARLAPLLLEMLRARAAGTNAVKCEGFGAEEVPRLSAQIQWLVASASICEGQLRDELAHDVDLWTQHWRTVRIRNKDVTRGGVACKSVPTPPSASPPTMAPCAIEVTPREGFGRCVVELRRLAESSPKRPTLNQKQVAAALKEIWPHMRDKQLRAIRKAALKNFPEWRVAGRRRTL